jgi:glutamine synthetase
VTEEQRKDLGVELLPANLLDATRELEKDDVLRAALGKTPREDYVDYYVKTKQAEFNEWHNEVTQWEVDRYLQLF